MIGLVVTKPLGSSRVDNVETVRDRAKLYIRHYYETDKCLSIGEVTFDQRSHLAANSASVSAKIADNSEMVIFRLSMSLER